MIREITTDEINEAYTHTIREENEKAIVTAINSQTLTAPILAREGMTMENQKSLYEIKIKLKKCCLTCKHFDPSGIKGLGLYMACVGEGQERVIACGHMAVCKEYLENDD